MTTEKKKRPKLVYKNISEIAHLWVHETQPEAKCRNAHYRDGVIYSYGEHFPIAKIVKDKKGEKTILFTLDTYSSTTAQHIRDVAQACRHLPKLYMVDVPRWGEPVHSRNIIHWVRKIEEATNKIERAKDNKKWYLRQAQDELAQLEKYIKYYKIKTDDSIKKVRKLCKPELYEKQIREYEEKKAAREKYIEEHWDEVQEKRVQDRVKRQEAKRVAAEKKYKEQIDNWRAGQGYRIPRQYGGYDLLRYRNGRIETSQSVQVPVEAAKRLYERMIKVVAAGGCIDTCKDKILDYQVKEMTQAGIKVGCHYIQMQEIQNMAQQMGWISQ